MPSPIGHMMAGAAAGVLIAGRDRSRALPLIVFAAAGAAPDLDLLIPFMVHRGPTHSLAAALFAGAVAWLLVRKPDGPMARKPGSPGARDLRFAIAVAAAYATHTLTDWLSADTTPPMGLMALWPFTGDYYVAPVAIFLAVSRRYWLAETWLLNFRALTRELLIFGPLLWIAFWFSRAEDSRHGTRGARGV
jgi:membrane-bound metal-dependent hydrolase YbcI (DUF457 family)